MATGYTDLIKSGEITAFREFALLCARAFPPLASMRDESLAAPLPERVAPDSYYSECVDDARAELLRLKEMTGSELSAEWEAAHSHALNAWAERQAERSLLRTVYSKMLEHVNAWQPPTGDHVALKNFMRHQLTQSIEFDCNDDCGPKPTMLSLVTWHSRRVETAKYQLASAEDDLAREIERANRADEWLQALRASLNEETVS